MEFQCLWPDPPLQTDLADQDLHVWCAVLDQPDYIVTRLAQLLSIDEQARASRFVFEKDRRHFTVGRGILRQILARYLPVAPAYLRFNYSPYGKPALDESFQLSFNLSHSHGLAVYAVTRRRKVGIDLERVRPLEDMTGLARRFFSPAEFEALSSLSALDEPVGFFSAWTRKEAYVKAVGSGLSHPLHEFDVSLTPDRPAELLYVKNDPGASKRWSLASLQPALGYIGALCLEAHDCQTTFWRFSLAE
ncbi:MAG TPA: 4'-phosphopantetheinyl transferase superfamily protein [Anaerolineae bacterium]|nr:4'-phosphopantetheinyl transferase superfamily protein [Anaerolineae bacterium]